ncbi:MAG: alanine racemase [Deltaproteobacteria bacterium]|nr:alanine racemase [Deltaproteobacteria bacterium]
MPILRPTYLEIDLKAIRHNYAVLKTKLKSQSEILSVVKANAYGHGDVEICKTLEKEGCSYFGVATIEEGLKLRQQGIKSKILILSGCGTKYLNVLSENKLTPVISSLYLARHFHENLKKKMSVHIKIDTGMGRLGIHAEKAIQAFEEISTFKNIEVEGVMSHFGQSELPKSERTLSQKKKFQEIVKVASKRFPHIKYYHMANSAALLYDLKMNLDLVRVGIALYGCSPDLSSPNLMKKMNLKPVLQLKTAIWSLKKMPRDSYISYGESFKTKRETMIATIPLGYADGFKRAYSNKGCVLVRGQKAPLVGAICMDLSMIDVTDIPGLCVGDEVVCLGSQGPSEITASDLAQWAGTISYEIVTSFTSRLPIRYKS